MSKGYLNQIIAIEKGIKSKAHSAISELHRISKTTELFEGFARTYQKKDDDGEDMPQESKRVAYTVKDMLRGVENIKTDLYNVTARKDWTNCVAKGNVTLDGVEILKDAPVSFLLFLEKELTDVRTFIDNIRTLDEKELWMLDENSGLYKTKTNTTIRTKKTAKPIVLYNATEHHPAQTQLITEDISIGSWHTTRISGAIPQPIQEQYLARIDRLLIAIKEAREAANMCIEETTPDVGKVVFDFIFSPVKAV